MNEPTTVVIFGITGDLANRKLLPAFFHLWKAGKLSKKFNIVGFSRRDFTDTQIREELFKSLPKNATENEKYDFLDLVSYKKGIFDDVESYNDLLAFLNKKDEKFAECSNKLFYLAVPPTLYETILTNIWKSGLHIHCGTKERQTKVLIEKPFGNDLKTAKKLDLLLGKYFRESQIYRIDHYLGKETLQNILSFRFSNTLFEPLWNKKHISKVEINLFEKHTVYDRGAFYDKTGALKDVGQNHILQMLALVAMEKPKAFESSEIRKERSKVLSKIYLNVKTFRKNSEQAQYDGYLKEKDVPQNSKTETFFKIESFIKNARWSGVPFVLQSGKGMKESKTEIKIYFKDPSPMKSFLPQTFGAQEVNTLTFRIQPDEGIEILFWVKTPGFENKIEPKKLSFNYSDSKFQIPDAYERILYDCVKGDQTLFPTTSEISSQWRFIEKALLLLKKLPLNSYKISQIF